MIAIAALIFWLAILALTRPRLKTRCRPPSTSQDRVNVRIETRAETPQRVNNDDLIAIRAEYIAALEEIENALDGLTGSDYKTQSRRITLLTRRAELTRKALKIEKELEQ